MPDPMDRIAERGIGLALELMEALLHNGVREEEIRSLASIAVLLNVHAAQTDQSLRAVFDQAISLVIIGVEA